MIEILIKMFKGKPERSTIKIKDKCADCGRKITIEITPTSGGFGVLGGALFKSSPDKYLMKCPACFQKSKNG